MIPYLALPVHQTLTVLLSMLAGAAPVRLQAQTVGTDCSICRFYSYSFQDESPTRPALIRWRSDARLPFISFAGELKPDELPKDLVVWREEGPNSSPTWTLLDLDWAAPELSHLGFTHGDLLVI